MDKKEDEVTLYVYADEFLFAAEELENSLNTNKVSTASYYLYGHSLELAYKSFLYTKGYDINQLTALGHNLENSLKECMEHGIQKSLDINTDYLRIVRGINKYYSKKDFEYMKRTTKSYPNLQDVNAVVKETVNLAYTIVSNGYGKSA